MPFDLLHMQWLFARRRTAGGCRIAPWQITESHENDPVVCLDFNRPDGHQPGLTEDINREG